jgi:hypothetical protein
MRLNTILGDMSGAARSFVGERVLRAVYAPGNIFIVWRVLYRAGEVSWWGAVISALSAMDAYRVMLRALCRGRPLYGAGMNLAGRVWRE